MKTTLLVRSLLVLLFLVAAGCGDWSRRTSPSALLIEPEDAATLGYAITWSTNLDVPLKNKLSSVTLLDDTIFTVETPGNLVSAISVRDGKVLWRRILGEKTENVYPPIRDEEHVYFNNDTLFFKLGIVNGDLLATATLSNVVETGPLMMDRYAIFGSADGTVFAHDIDTGYAKWSYLLSGGIVTSPVQSGPNVFVTDSKGVYAMLDAATGELVFRGRTFGPITAKSASVGSEVFIASQDQSLYAINRLNGSDEWVYRTKNKLTGDVSAIGQSVYLPLPGKNLLALDAGDGSERWDAGMPATVVGESGGKVLLQYKGGLRWVDKANGRVLADVPTLPLQTVIPVPDQGGMIVVSPGGRFHRLLPKR